LGMGITAAIETAAIETAATGAPPLHRRTAGGPRVRCLFFRYVRSLFGQRLLIFWTRVLIFAALDVSSVCCEQ
jgi:hypothetical protein